MGEVLGKFQNKKNATDYANGTATSDSPESDVVEREWVKLVTDEAVPGTSPAMRVKEGGIFTVTDMVTIIDANGDEGSVSAYYAATGAQYVDPTATDEA